MDISPEIEAKVQQYLSRKLNAQESASLEEMINGDENLKLYLIEQQKLRMAIGVLGNQKFKAQLQELGKELSLNESGSVPTSFKGRIRPLYLGLALAASLVLVLYFFLPKPTAPISKQELLAQYFAMDQESPSQQRGNNQNLGPIDSLFNLASKSYFSQNYNDAISLFQQLLTIDSTDVESAYFLGLSYAQMKEWEKSNRVLKDIDPGSYYSDRAEWFRVANGIQSGNQTGAKDILTIIRKDSLHEYFKDAQEVWERLKE